MSRAGRAPRERGPQVIRPIERRGRSPSRARLYRSARRERTPHEDQRSNGNQPWTYAEERGRSTVGEPTMRTGRTMTMTRKPTTTSPRAGDSRDPHADARVAAILTAMRTKVHGKEST